MLVTVTSGAATATAIIFASCAWHSSATFCGDDIAYLQSSKAWNAGATSATCDLNVLNSGECVGDGACLRCVPTSDGQKIPTNDSNGFPNGFLRCANDPDVSEAATCTISNESPFYYSFQNPENYLQCTDSSACFNWRLKDFSALCCDGNQACRTDDRPVATGEANFILTPGNPNCQQDVCCRGISSCSFRTNISGVHSAACRSFNACEQATMSLSKDLFCSRPAACRQGTFSFASDSPFGSHCVQCLDAGSTREPFAQPCEESQMSFTGGNIELQCAFNTCNNTVISLSDSCIHINCEAAVSCGGMTVEGSGSQCFCSGPGCSNLLGSLTCSTPATDTPCGANICKEDGSPSAFCDRGLNAPPNCSACVTSGGMSGDPHITTLDGRHYTVLQQGNFLLWSFSGLDAEVPSGLVNGQTKKIPVDFRIYANYAGQASWAKGILVVDNGAKSAGQALEVTSFDCKWKTRTGGWRPAETELLKLTSADGISFGAFNITREGNSLAKTVVELLMYTPSGLTSIARLGVTCKPGHHLAAKLEMSRAAQNHLVKGELAPKGHSTLVEGSSAGASMVATDSEFASNFSWKELGGSEVGATYLASTAGPNFLSKGCDPQDEAAAMDICTKHWEAKALDTPKSQILGAKFQPNSIQKANFLADCVFDVCAGGGETAAELAADLL